jgi:predicted anti-sigma-YlaC factor YlaD
MKCDQFKEIFLTEYLDEALSSEKRQSCDTHLQSCAFCAGLVADLKAMTEQTFKQVESLQPSAKVWTGITQKLQPSPSWLEKLLERVTLPRLTFAIPVLASLVFLSVLQFNPSTQSYDLTRTYLVESLNGDMVSEMAAEDTSDTSFGTVIEDFFM